MSIYEKLLVQLEKVVRNHKAELSIDFVNLEDLSLNNRFEKMLILQAY